MRAHPLVWLALGLCACSVLVREPAPAAPRARVRARAAAAPERTPALRLPSVPHAGPAAGDGVEFLLLPFGSSDVTDAPPPGAAEPTPRAALRGVATAPRRSTRAAAVGAVAAGLAGGAASLAALRGMRRARRALPPRGA
jgi:hypothetical protein